MTNRRSRIMRRAGISALFLLAAAQLVPVSRTNPPVHQEIVASADVKEVLKRACWDCHSDETRWPWYSHLAPVSWFLARDVRQGRKNLNFSEWPVQNLELTSVNLDQIGEQVLKRGMPPAAYRLLHSGARLTPADRRLIEDWVALANAWEDFPAGAPEPLSP